MKMICDLCKGTGVIMRMPKNLTLPKMTHEEAIKSATKELCPMCKGAGEVESGFLARQMGLVK